MCAWCKCKINFRTVQFCVKLLILSRDLQYMDSGLMDSKCQGKLEFFLGGGLVQIDFV